MNDIATLQESAVSLMRRWAEEDADRTAILRRLAGVLVDLRACFHDTAGNPDWAGRTWEYRQTVHLLYKEAALGREAEQSLQGALRYHVGNAVRERVPDAELQRVGLLKVSPRERIAAVRAGLVADAEAVSKGRSRTAEPLALAESASRSLDALSRRMGTLSPETAGPLVECLERLQVTLRLLLKSAKKSAARG